MERRAGFTLRFRAPMSVGSLRLRSLNDAGCNKQGVQGLWRKGRRRRVQPNRTNWSIIIKQTIKATNSRHRDETKGTRKKEMQKDTYRRLFDGDAVPEGADQQQ
jgi:hypothetical protein